MSQQPFEDLRPEFWTVKDVSNWLETNSFQHLQPAFLEHEISGTHPGCSPFVTIPQGAAPKANILYLFCPGE